MLCNTLRRTGGHAAASHGHASAVSAVASIDRAAPYMATMSMNNFHAHAEPNFRKRPVGWAGWANPKYCDPYQPYMQQTPVRHVDRGSFNGMWFGMGHFAIKNHFGFMHWKMWLRLAFCGVTGLVVSAFVYCLRMSRNGWQWKNRGAVFGLD